MIEASAKVIFSQRCEVVHCIVDMMSSHMSIMRGGHPWLGESIKRTMPRHHCEERCNTNPSNTRRWEEDVDARQSREEMCVRSDW